MPKEVVFAWNYLEWGGAQIYFLGIARRIMDRCRVRFVFPRGTDPQFLDFCKAAGIGFELIESRADLAPADGIGRKLRRHLNKIRAEISMIRALNRYDRKDSVLHVELSPWQSVTALAVLSAGGPVFSTMHNRLPTASGWRRRLWNLKFAMVSRLENFRLFTSNRDAKESLAPYVSPDFLGRTAVTYTNVDPDEVAEAFGAEFDALALRMRFGIPENELLVLSVGQFIDRKGRWDVLEAARILERMGEKISFVWITNSELSEAEREKVGEFGLGARFRLIRSADIGTNHLDLMRFLRIADVFVLPSYVEGLPISLLEAMSLGIPSVSTDVNGIPEAIIDGETGLLIAPGDAPALAAAVRSLSLDDGLRTRLGSAGREKVLREFNEKEVAEIAFEAYAKACKGKR
ncbi:MAG: glycosyltransferase family 4 protein [Acidobacteria bacterium]|nr:glycosyltransferase family 4 protein [Acidobacteriota bacterium]